MTTLVSLPVSVVMQLTEEPGDPQAVLQTLRHTQDTTAQSPGLQENQTEGEFRATVCSL